MIVWSPSSWALWKQCPMKYKIKKINRWTEPKRKKDHFLMNLAVPGLVVDRLIQLWFYRNKLEDCIWFEDSFEMIWNEVYHQTHPRWENDTQLNNARNETWEGLKNCVEMLYSLDLPTYSIFPQVSFFEPIEDKPFALTGAADLLLVSKQNDTAILIDLKNAHYREKVTKDQLIIYKLGIEQSWGIHINQVGYLLFNPRVKDWKWFTISPAIQNKLINNIAKATLQVQNEEFDYKWNFYGCPRFCDARFSCDKFQKLIEKKDNVSEDYICSYI